jgi:hypothetical protein
MARMDRTIKTNAAVGSEMSRLFIFVSPFEFGNKQSNT